MALLTPLTPIAPRLRAAAFLGLAALTGAPAGPAALGLGAQQLTQDEALTAAFPDAEVTRHTAYLEAEDIESAAALAGPGVEVETSIVTYYVARRDGSPVGVAYFDAHRVRTLPEVLMVVVGTDDRVRLIETVSFKEPPEYRAPEGWLRQYGGRTLAEAELKGDVAMITGATLTARAVAQAVRRVLALHAIIDPMSGG